MFTVFIGSSSESLEYAKVVERVAQRHPLFKPKPWWTAFRNGRSTFDQILGLLPETDFAIFLTAPDDVTISRGKETDVLRDNVLLEYGIFSGHLGPEHTLRLHIGKIDSPSDLYGMVDVLARIEYRQVGEPEAHEVATLELAVEKALAELLSPTEGGARLDIDFMRARNFNLIHSAPEKIIELLEAQQAARLGGISNALGDYNFLPSILARYTITDIRQVGLDQHQSTTALFIDFDEIARNPRDEHLLSHAFSHFIASTLAKEFTFNPPSRFAIHDADDQLSFLASALEHLHARPAIVELREGKLPGRVQGRYFRSERAAIVQAVTSTGNVPNCCALELMERGVNSVALFSMIAKAEHLDEIKLHCGSMKMKFFPMLIQNLDGSFSLWNEDLA